MASSFFKDPQAVLDYAIDWAAWLGDDTIAESTWTAPAGITIDSSESSATAATVWVSGGTVGQTYRLTNHIVTAAGREEDRTITLTVQER